MLPKRSIIQYIIYINFFHPIGSLGAKLPREKCPVGAKLSGAKRLGQKMDSGRNVPESFEVYGYQIEKGTDFYSVL